VTDVLEERSAGVILYRNGGDASSNGKNRLYLVLRYSAGHWDFAKGKKEEGESDIQTALREVREETGITDVRLHADFQRHIEYEFTDDRGTMIHKRVVFFLGSTGTEYVTLSDEHQEYAWREYDDASYVLTYAAARNMLAAAEDALGGGAHAHV